MVQQVYHFHNHSDPDDLLFISNSEEAPFDPEFRELFLQKLLLITGLYYYILTGTAKIIHFLKKQLHHSSVTHNQNTKILDLNN